MIKQTKLNYNDHCFLTVAAEDVVFFLEGGGGGKGGRGGVNSSKSGKSRGAYLLNFSSILRDIW